MGINKCLECILTGTSHPAGKTIEVASLLGPMASPATDFCPVS